MTAWIVRALVAAHFALLAVLDVETVATILRVEAAVVAWVFVARFSRVTWWRTDEGRHLMAFTVLVALFMTFASTVSIFGPYPGIDLVALGLYGLLVTMLWDRNLLFSHAQHDADTASHDEWEAQR